MNPSRKLRGLAAGSALFAAAGAYAATYHIVDLGPGYAEAVAGRMVAGNAPGGTQPMRWNGTGWQNLQVLAQRFGSTTGINAHGDVSGYAEDESFNSLAVIWPHGQSTYVALPVPAGVSSAFATAIAADGSAAGYATSGHCLTWDADGTVHDIGTRGSTLDCHATGMNDDGQVVGYGDSNTPRHSRHAFAWKAGHFRNLPPLPGGTDTWANGINRYGHAVGQSDGSAVMWRAVTPTDLGAPDASFEDLSARSINDRGDVVGSGFSGTDLRYEAILYSNGSAQTLNSLVDNLGDWNLEYAMSIDNAGTIVGFGWIGSTGNQHAFQLVPTGTR